MRLSLIGRVSAHTLLEQLTLTRGHVAQGDHLIARQESRVAELDRGGRDIEDALILLHNLRQTQEIFLGECQRMERQIADSSSE